MNRSLKTYIQELSTALAAIYKYITYLMICQPRNDVLRPTCLSRRSRPARLNRHPVFSAIIRDETPEQL